MLMREHGLLGIIVLLGHIQVQDGAKPAVDICARDSHSCVCSYEFLKNDLAQTILQSTPEQLLLRLKTYTCQDYRRLPEHLTIVGAEIAPPLPTQRRTREIGQINNAKSKRFARSAHAHHPKIHHRTQHDHRHEHAHLPQGSAHHVYVALGHEAKVPCKDNIHHGAPHSALKLLGWHHYDGRPVYAPGAIVDDFSSSLTIPSAQLNDIGIYNCSYKSWIDGKEIIGNSVHQLSVITDPISWYHVTTMYEAQACHLPDSHGIKRSIGRWIKDYVCPICTTHDQSVRCVDGEYSLQFAITAFNFPEQVQPYLNVEPDACSEECRHSLEALLLRIIKDSILKLFRLPIRLPSREKMMPAAESTLFEHMAGCLSGFQFQSPHCIPCNPGHYSSRGDSDCPPCDHGFYQPSPGASSCIPCDDGLDTQNAGATVLQECISPNYIMAEESVTKHSTLAIALMFVSALFIVAIIGSLMYCWCCHNSEVGAYLRKRCCNCTCLKRTKSKRVRKATASLQKGVTRTRSKIKRKLGQLKEKLRQFKSDTDYTGLSPTSTETPSSDASDATWTSHKPSKSKFQSVGTTTQENPIEIATEEPSRVNSDPRLKVDESESKQGYQDASTKNHHSKRNHRSHHRHHHKSREQKPRRASTDRSASRDVAVATLPDPEIEKQEQRYEARRSSLESPNLNRNPGHHDIGNGGRVIKHYATATQTNAPRPVNKDAFDTRQIQSTPPPPPLPRATWNIRP